MISHAGSFTWCHTAWDYKWSDSMGIQATPPSRLGAQRCTHAGAFFPCIKATSCCCQIYCTLPALFISSQIFLNSPSNWEGSSILLPKRYIITKSNIGGTVLQLYWLPKTFTTLTGGMKLLYRLDISLDLPQESNTPPAPRCSSSNRRHHTWKHQLKPGWYSQTVG